MKKRNESSLVSAVLSYLEILERLKVVGHYERLNSGKILAKMGRSIFHVRLCREGTADGFVALLDGTMCWWECKSVRGKQSDAQKIFESKVKGLGHKYWIVRELEDMRNYLKAAGAKVL